jgi:uncharacterized protein YkwD
MIVMLDLLNTLQHLFHPRRSNNHRPKVLHHTAFIYFTALVFVFASALHAIQFAPEEIKHVLGFSSTITASEVIDKTNQQRANSGLEPLVVNQALTQAALAKGQDMMSDQYWAHVAPDGTEPWYFIDEAGYTYNVAGENLARDFSETTNMMQAWMDSPTHRANILNSRYTEIGIAVIDGSLLGYDTTLVVQMFGDPRSETIAGQVAGSELADAEDRVTILQPQTEAAVLAGVSVPKGELRLPPLFTPLQLSKAFFLALIMMIIATLLYDSFVIGHRKTARMVGKNFAHLIFFSAVAFLVVFFKAGLVG